MHAGDQRYGPTAGSAMPFVPGAEQPMGGRDGRLPHQQVSLPRVYGLGHTRQTKPAHVKNNKANDLMPYAAMTSAMLTCT